MRRFLFLIVFFLVPFFAMAQASGGQIKRKQQVKPKQRLTQQTPLRKLANNEVILEDGKTIVKFETTQAVDLGLPSGTIWAGWNIDATSPQEEGGYYAWGEITTKEDFTWINYFDTKEYEEKTYPGISLPSLVLKFKTYGLGASRSIIGSSRDVARVKWGHPWKMPSIVQIEELVRECKIREVKIHSNSNIYFLLTGPNNKSILIPSTYIYYKGEKRATWSRVMFWSGELQPEKYDNDGMNAYCLKRVLLEHRTVIGNEWRCSGLNVRAVY